MDRVSPFVVLVPTTCEPNARPAVDKLTKGAVPLPLSATVCGLPAALSLIDRVPEAGPRVTGAKLTEIVQLAPAATDPPQLLLCTKVPLREIPLRVSAAFPVFESVIDCGALVVPTGCEP